ANPGPKFPGVGDRVEPEYPDSAAVGPPVAFADFDRRGLAGAVRPQYRGHRAPLGAQREPVDRGGPPISLDETADLDSGGMAHGRESSGPTNTVFYGRRTPVRDSHRDRA